MIRVGPFELVERIGRGGMGRVWRGRHVRQGLPVAVKVLAEERARADASANSTFYHEARTAARLVHPSIVMLIDYGEIDERAERDSGGELVAGSPYFAMELVGGGTLSDYGPTMASWKSLRHVLLQLLEALAYAHARGVVHRDIKPANILVLDEQSSTPSIKLSDFGLARVFAPDFDEVFERTQGTPPYMAPEHIRGNWRSQGPWTDLYALGCVTYQLVTGHLPFVDRDGKDLLRAHLDEPVPPPTPRFAVPDEFEDWLLHLLAKDTNYRFRRAADAAWELSRMPDIEVAEATTASPVVLGDYALTGVVGERADTVSASSTTQVTGPPSFDEHGLSMPSSFETSSAIDSEAREQLSWRSPPLPVDWERGRREQEASGLIGVGLELFDIRERPLVGREAERDRLWRSLREVYDTASARVILLSGGAGHGKSRLSRWLAERAHEVGAANVLTARHDEVDRGGSELGNMLAEFLRCEELDRSQVYSVLERWLADGEPTTDERVFASVLAGMICTDDDVTETTAAARRDALTRFVERLAVERPIIITLENVHWGEESLAWLESIVDSSRSDHLPVLFVLTARQDALSEEQAAMDRLRNVVASPIGSHLEIGPLPPDDHRELVGDMLSMEPELAEAVADRTQGNPLYAIQLVGDWVQRQVLSIGDEGFRLPSDVELTLPESLISLCDERIVHLARDLEQPERPLRTALELAAVLGREFRGDEWRSACALHEVDAPDELLRHMEWRGILVRREHTWEFAHGVMRDALLSRAEEDGRLTDAHATAAALFEESATRNPYGRKAARRAHHLLRAELFDDALMPLTRAAEGRRREGRFVRATEFLDDWESALARADIPGDDPRRAEGWIVSAHTKILEGELEDAERELERAREVIDAVDRETLEAEWCRVRAKLFYDRGGFDEARRLYQKAVDLFAEAGDDESQAIALQGLASVGRSTGQYRASVDAYRRAIALFDDSTEELGSCSTFYGLADAHRRLGELNEARECLSRALAGFEEHGLRFGKAHALNLLGEIERQRGDLEAAERHYRDALSLMGKLHAGDLPLVKVNLALVLLERGEWPRAGALLSKVLWEVENRGECGYEIAIHAALVPCMAHAELWGDFDEHLDRTETLADETGIIEQDIALVLELGARVASAAQQPERSARAQRLADAQYAGLEI